MITFTVLGMPQTAGSKRAIPIKNRSTGEWVKRQNGSPLIAVMDDNPKSKEWRNAVACEARKVYSGPLLTGPLQVTFRFYMPRPAGHFGSGKNANQLKASSPTWPITRPDALKMARAAEDALTNVIWRDDSQIVSEHLLKYYTHSDPARLVVTIERMEGDT